MVVQDKPTTSDKHAAYRTHCYCTTLAALREQLTNCTNLQRTCKLTACQADNSKEALLLAWLCYDG